MGQKLIIGALLLLLAASVWVAYEGLALHPEFSLPPEGYVFMAVGIVFSLIVGCGLMLLVFFSSRRGYDEPPEFHTRHEPPRKPLS
jgi:hypothetical protein